MSACAEQIGYLGAQTHYLTAHPRLNYYAVVPFGSVGPDGSGKGWWQEPHDRDRFLGKFDA